MDYNNGFSLSFFFNLFLSFLWIGAQFPQEKFLSYGRILTLDFHFLIMCILMSYLSSYLILSPPQRCDNKIKREREIRIKELISCVGKVTAC